MKAAPLIYWRVPTDCCKPVFKQSREISRLFLAYCKNVNPYAIQVNVYLFKIAVDSGIGLA